MEIGRIFTKREENLGKTLLESECGPDDSDGTSQFARCIFKIMELGVKRMSMRAYNKYAFIPTYRVFPSILVGGSFRRGNEVHRSMHFSNL